MSKRTVTVVLRGVISVGIIAVGLMLMLALIGSRQKAPQVEIPEQALRVDTVIAEFKDVPVDIRGLGEVQSRDVVDITPEISGRIINVNPDLEVGGVIAAGETLFEIDPRDYIARHAQSIASVNQLKSAIERLKKQFSIDQKRIETFERSRILAKAELDRVKLLHERDRIAPKSQVDSAEMAYNNANDSYAQISQGLELFPIRINEAEDNLASAEAMADLSKTNLERTRVSVPFEARVKSVSVEAGQYVSPGMSVVTLANDSVLEISVSLDSKLASSWLNFEDANSLGKTAWFGELAQVPVEISWGDVSGWNAALHRIEKFDEETRTINVVIRVTAHNALNPTRGTQALVAGMFCRVTIPGKMANGVVELPIESVSFGRDDEGFRTVFLAKESADDGKLRLATARVRESHIAGESIFITEGLQEGDQIVTTRLINPLSNSLLSTTSFAAGETD